MWGLALATGGMLILGVVSFVVIRSVKSSPGVDPQRELVDRIRQRHGWDVFEPFE
jgi:hypothetical protein